MKKKTLNIGLLSLFLFLGACTPDDWYSPNPQPNPQPSVQQYIFDEEFNNDQNEWSFADPVNYAYGVVSDGTFKFDYNDDLSEAYYAAKFFGFNPYDNFSLETKIGSNNNMGLLFGYDNQKGAYGYSFTIDYDGYYALYDEGGNGYGGELQVLVEPQTGNFVNANGNWNILRIVQKGNRWIGYVNDVKVFNIKAQNIKGNGIGFVDVAQTQGESDYIVAKWYE